MIDTDALANLISEKIQVRPEQEGSDYRKTGVSIVVVNVQGDLIMAGDTYKGNVGFTGPNAGKSSSHTIFNVDQKQVFSDIDLQVLAEQLKILRQKMTQDAAGSGNEDIDQTISIGEIAKAEKAAFAGDAREVLTHLKSAGKWAFDTATKIGVSVAAKAIEGSLGL